MHTLGPDARHLLELLHGYIAGADSGRVAPVTCPIATLEIADVLAGNSSVTLRNMVAILDDVGQRSPQLAELLAGHFGVAAALRHTPHFAFPPVAVFSVNGSHPHATVEFVVDIALRQIATTDAGGAPAQAVPDSHVDTWITYLWLLHCAALVGTLSRVADVVATSQSDVPVHVSVESARALVREAAARCDHALGTGMEAESVGYGARYDMLDYVTLLRHAVFLCLGQLAAEADPSLEAALSVVFERAAQTFGVPAMLNVATAEHGEAGQ